jgi:exosome complex RNA-binding protein Rrp42 (RNase PH superfamily)
MTTTTTTIATSTTTANNAFDSEPWADALQKLDPKVRHSTTIDCVFPLVFFVNKTFATLLIPHSRVFFSFTKTTTTKTTVPVYHQWVLLPKRQAFVTSFFSQSTRPDGRLFGMCRTTKITRGILQTHDTVGSSLVRLGNTQVLCGISLQIGTPTALSSNHNHHHHQGNDKNNSSGGGGDVVVIMLSSQQHQGTIAAAATEEQLQSIITNMLDLSTLVIINGQAAWRILLTVQVLQDDGNVWDASLLAAVAALTNVRLPATKMTTTSTAAASASRRNLHTASTTTTTTKAGGTSRLELLDDPNYHEALVFHYLPVPLTVGVYRSSSNHNAAIHLVADPTPDEAPLLQGYLTMVVTDGNEIVHAGHASQVGLTREHMAVAAHMAYGRGKEIRDLLQD